jgi:hypothetical protein
MHDSIKLLGWIFKIFTIEIILKTSNNNPYIKPLECKLIIFFKYDFPY